MDDFIVPDDNKSTNNNSNNNTNNNTNNLSPLVAAYRAWKERQLKTMFHLAKLLATLTTLPTLSISNEEDKSKNNNNNNNNNNKKPEQYRRRYRELMDAVREYIHKTLR